MARPFFTYERRRPDSTLYRIVQAHLETFCADAARLRDGERLPRFVEQEFRDFLRCGWLAGGFARLRCGECGLDRLVAFSCKGCGFCPSCGGRRMVERTAHLVDHVLPDVPIRQWILTLPHTLRYQVAWNHALCRAVVVALLRAVTGALRRQARMAGVRDGRSGAVAVIQRFGGSQGFDLHAGLQVPAGQRDRLDRLCRYLLRPPAATERVTLTETGQVRLALRHPWADGTTPVEFEPVAFLERLAVPGPRPRVNLIL